MTKIHQIFTISQLLKMGARYTFVPVTTSDLAKIMEKSQQSISKELIDMEKSGLIKRTIVSRKHGIMITAKGYEEVKKITEILKTSLQTRTIIKLHGRIVTGVGEGAHYMSMNDYTKQFKKKIGYIPFPGTLNIKLENTSDKTLLSMISDMKEIMINGFADKKRTYGWVKCYPAKLKDISCHLVILERTHHDNSIVEIISKVEIRKRAKLKNGSKVVITIKTN